MRETRLLIAFALALATIPTQLHAQAITVDDVIDAWDVMADMVIGAAELMPADQYGYSPGEPLRSFADQINHTTASNIGFAGSVNAGRPSFQIPDPSNPPRDRDAVVDLLRHSFEYFRGGLMTLEQADLEAEVPWGPASNQRMITRLKAILIVTSHLQREHGKTIMYLRAQGITPPPSGSWSF